MVIMAKYRRAITYLSINIPYKGQIFYVNVLQVIFSMAVYIKATNLKTRLTSITNIP
jgi:hypothetical protein